ncbi:MAG TPA: arylamine N-acetyltransferase [Candidatus Binatia bacterium]|nr:arylamine N-acetyltransferase [Candidatus Binatia bacterium]
MDPSLCAAPTQQLTTAAFDLDAYSARINYDGSRDVSAQPLKALHFAHAHNVPFEILDIHLGKPISLELAALFSKIVTHKRAGYCYEVNSFFTVVLRAFGFRVQGLLARVLIAFPIFRPRSHQLLSVTVDDEYWIADVGFGSCCLREPLRLTPGFVNEQGPDRFRLRTEPGQSYIPEAFLGGRWQDLYAFTLEPFDLVDYEPFNYWTRLRPSPLDAAEIARSRRKTDASSRLTMSSKLTAETLRRQLWPSRMKNI